MAALFPEPPVRGRALPAAMALGLVLALGACAGIGVHLQKEATTLAGIGGDEVLVVGVVELVPPLRESEQEVNLPNDLFNMEAMIENRAFLSAGSDPRQRPEDSRFRFNPRLGELFYFAVPRSMPYVLGGDITVDMRNFRQRRIVVPGPLRLQARDSDQAIYIGTLRLTRDEFNEVIAVDVIDEYPQAAQTFGQRFGGGAELRRSLLQIPGR